MVMQSSRHINFGDQLIQWSDFHSLRTGHNDYITYVIKMQMRGKIYSLQWIIAKKSQQGLHAYNISVIKMQVSGNKLSFLPWMGRNQFIIYLHHTLHICFFCFFLEEFKVTWYNDNISDDFFRKKNSFTGILIAFYDTELLLLQLA